ALLGCKAFGQADASTDPLAKRSLKISDVPLAEPPARDYQNFFDEVRFLGGKVLSDDARRSLRLTDQELRSLITITADLAEASLVLTKAWHPWKFEALMETIEQGKVDSSVQAKLEDFKQQWTKIILDHANRLQEALGEDRFGQIDRFVHSGKSMFK